MAPLAMNRIEFLELMGPRTSVLLVGNHIEREPVLAGEREFVVVLNGNENGVPDARVDMLASFTELPGESTGLRPLVGAHRLVESSSAARLLSVVRKGVRLIECSVVDAAQRAQGLTVLDAHATPTIGFTLIVMLHMYQVPVRLAGFSWYQAREDRKGRSHRPDKERAWCSRTLPGNTYFTMTEETLSWMRR